MEEMEEGRRGKGCQPPLLPFFSGNIKFNMGIMERITKQRSYRSKGIKFLLSMKINRGLFIKGFEVDDDFAVDFGVKLDDLALPEKVQLTFTYRKWS